MTAFKLAAGAPFPVSKIARLGGGDLTLGKPTEGFDWQMIVVYRGKHCPYCSRYLQELEPLVPCLNGIGIDVAAVSADSLDRAEPHIAKLGVDLTIGYDLSIAQMKSLGLYISEPRSDAESPRPFAEPGLFVINGEGNLQVTDISNGPFVCPHLETLVGGLEFIRNPDNNYPIRGMMK
ncbi:redoxin domain-containing protein [Aliiroseovarius crassostreae]|uniref:redoxin domain-containing protein n=1 Tax=Aliiroseovarius crassostreae TaxID=154981 RepID=UPI0021AF4F71|nr:redoxin domain-containing protein [Aliiroseovarius crassostreae]UWP98664.1 redoxin family protein [Aliiroseovarius crassostreae]